MAKRLVAAAERLDTLDNAADQATGYHELQSTDWSRMAGRRAAAFPAAALVLVRAELMATSNALRAETLASRTVCASSVSQARRRQGRSAQVGTERGREREEKAIKLACGCGGGGGGFGASVEDSFSLYFLLSLATKLSSRRMNGFSEKGCRGLELEGDVGVGDCAGRGFVWVGSALPAARAGCSNDMA